ncbi:MAG: AIR synthase-related protein [Chloroflexota bacterium]
MESDVAPLNHLVEAMMDASDHIHVLRDPTRGGVASTLNEIARQSGVSIMLQEQAIPVRPAVKAACEMLGFDPLYIANEGRLLAIVGREDAERVLETMRRMRYGEDSVTIGEVQETNPGPNSAGQSRVITLLVRSLEITACL